MNDKEAANLLAEIIDKNLLNIESWAEAPYLEALQIAVDKLSNYEIKPSLEDQQIIDSLKYYEEKLDWRSTVNLILDSWDFEYGTSKWDGETLELITGGWSDNEQIVRYMQDGLFWFFCWQESKRGGYYKFKVRKEN